MSDISEWRAIIQFGDRELDLGTFSAPDFNEAMRSAKTRLGSATIGVRPASRPSPDYSQRGGNGFRKAVQARQTPRKRR